MRDPQGTITKECGKIIRTLNKELADNHFLFTSKASSLVSEQKLVRYEFITNTKIISDEVPFVTYPYEWCDAQLRDAALLTLQISRKIAQDGYELKDASAWNVIFDQCKPIFCDHLSFQKIENTKWWAFGQFVRNFIFPLVLSKYKKINGKTVFTLNRDGVDSDFVRNILGIKRYLTPYWLLMINPIIIWNTSINKKASTKSNHESLYTLLQFFLNLLTNDKKQKSKWLNYQSDREHYKNKDIAEKSKIIEQWIVDTKPNWVADFGCNTGEYSKIAASHGAEVVALDMDHESIQDLYMNSQGKTIYPVLVNLDDICGGRGWKGQEFMGLLTRLNDRIDMVLMLALVHHLAISASIPYMEIARMAAENTKRYLVIEFIDSNDPLVILLCSHRNRSVDDFGLETQLSAFKEYFSIIKKHTLSGCNRHLYLMIKK